MAEELENQTQSVDPGIQMYLDQIEELKKNSVSKELYEESQNREKELLRSIVDGKTFSAPAEEQPTRSEDEILADIAKDTSNLQHIKYVLELHDKRMERGFNDFVPQGRQITPTDEDIRDADAVADFLRELVDTANGDEAVFNNEYQRRVKDIPLPKRK